jgi:hypothetical protein
MKPDRAFIVKLTQRNAQKRLLRPAELRIYIFARLQEREHAACPVFARR